MFALRHSLFLLVLLVWLAWDDIVSHGLRLASSII